MLGKHSSNRTTFLALTVGLKGLVLQGVLCILTFTMIRFISFILFIQNSNFFGGVSLKQGFSV